MKSSQEKYDENNGLNDKIDQTIKQRTAEDSGTSVGYLRNEYCTSKKTDSNFTVDDHTCSKDSDMECKSDNQTQLEGMRRRVVWTQSDSSGGSHLYTRPKSEHQAQYKDSRSTYLYDRNPLQDPRFTRLIERLVPLRNQLKVETKKVLDSNKKGYPHHEICFKDICLNETCRLVFKIMNKGNGNN